MRITAILLPLALATLVLAPARAASADEPNEWQYAPPPEPPVWKKNLSGFALDLDFTTALPRASTGPVVPGFGFDVRPGYRFAAGPIFIIPQGDLGSVTFPRFDTALRFGAGGRVGVDAGRVEPSVYAYGGGFWNVWKSGFGLRAGAALDVRLGKRLSPGIHVDYDTASWETGRVNYVGLGVHLGLVL